MPRRLSLSRSKPKDKEASGTDDDDHAEEEGPGMNLLFVARGEGGEGLLQLPCPDIWFGAVAKEGERCQNRGVKKTTVD